MHARSFEPRLHHELVAAFHHAGTNGPACSQDAQRIGPMRMRQPDQPVGSILHRTHRLGSLYAPSSNFGAGLVTKGRRIRQARKIGHLGRAGAGRVLRGDGLLRLDLPDGQEFDFAPDPPTNGTKAPSALITMRSAAGSSGQSANGLACSFCTARLPRPACWVCCRTMDVLTRMPSNACNCSAAWAKGNRAPKRTRAWWA